MEVTYHTSEQGITLECNGITASVIKHPKTKEYPADPKYMIPGYHISLRGCEDAEILAVMKQFFLTEVIPANLKFYNKRYKL